MKIAIAGYGVEGEASYNYWSADPANDITIVDDSETPKFIVPEGVKTILGEDAFQKLDGFDLVIRTPGLSPHRIKTDGKIWSATNEFFEKCPAPIIGVTGSKGKGTTASLITSILQAAGRTVYLVGNIGQPALHLLPHIQPSDIIVYELSSFQLWDVERSPQTAVVLFIEPEHLDVHADMAEYVAAKANIARFQYTNDDIIIYNGENEYSRSIAQLSSGVKIGYPSESTVHIKDGSFYNGEQKICSVDVLQIRGAHNQSNAIAAINAAWKFVKDPETIEAGLRTFRGLPHRLAFVRTVRGVDFYDDSIATTPTSAVAALAAFEQPKVLIIGGSDKGADYTPLVTAIIKSGSIRAIVSVGANGTRITGMLDDHSLPLVHRVDSKDMNEIVKTAASLAKPNDVVILSPAAASFDMFKSYVDRGEQFVADVNALED
ncbi:MAG: putative UDP-N-acetylmuramoylalanine--D-glutamate ligase [Candidatus Saccharibacteria bacterium]|nr:putative UDP-N-acetylmuramoylalanine--D-glutamate ligase [Candidatus Saccharibacteria bacterium]